MSPSSSRSKNKPSKRPTWKEMVSKVFARLVLAWIIFRPWRWGRHIPPKHRLTFNGLNGAKSQKIEHFITTAVRTWNLTYTCWFEVLCSTYITLLFGLRRLCQMHETMYNRTGGLFNYDFWIWFDLFRIPSQHLRGGGVLLYSTLYETCSLKRFIKYIKGQLINQ
jgi:hypothetical protein